MTSPLTQKEKSLADLLKLLSNPTRLSIFQLLMTGAHCNCELAEILDLSLSLVSHHLRLMTESGLVKAQRDEEDARWIHFSIDTERLNILRDLFWQTTDPANMQDRIPACIQKRLMTVEKTQ
jgi:ArsR family transcriptional regulator